MFLPRVFFVDLHKRTFMITYAKKYRLLSKLKHYENCQTQRSIEFCKGNPEMRSNCARFFGVHLIFRKMANKLISPL